jgi:hypothetical protein
MSNKLLIVLTLFICYAQVAFAQDLSQQDLPYKYVGNRWSKKFHRPSCLFAKRIWPKRLRLFHFRKDAVAAEFKPCNWCLPRTWTTLHGAIIQPKN